MLFLITVSLIGVLLGLLMGLIPGFHPNLIASIILITINEVIQILPTQQLAVILVSVSVSANFFEFIKAMILGVPEESTALSVMPIHELMLQKRGLEVLTLVSTGCLGSLLISILLLPVLVLVNPLIHNAVKQLIPAILISLSLHLILKERKPARIKHAIILFFLAGALGIITFNLRLNQPFLPLLTGLFGLGVIMESLINKAGLPAQMRSVAIELDKKSVLKSLSVSVVAASVLSYVPAIGPAQSTLIAEELRDKKRPRYQQAREFIISVAGINTADVFFSLTALFTINKARSGVLVVIKEIMPVLNIHFFLTLLSALILSGIISYFAFNKVGSFLLKRVHKISVVKLNAFVVLFVSLITLVSDGLVGLVILFVGGLIGYYAVKKGVRKSHAMSTLTLPTILWYLGVR